MERFEHLQKLVDLYDKEGRGACAAAGVAQPRC